MVNISYFCGSLNSSSRTRETIELLINYLNLENANYNSLNEIQKEIIPCQGQKDCFFKGYCNLDNLDNFNMTKEAILQSDVIILGSPVYGDMVSSYTKLFLDRLSYLEHLMPLARTPCVLIVSTHSKSNRTLNYLFNTLSYYGCSIVGIIIVDHKTTPSQVVEQAKIVANKLSMILASKIQLSSNCLLEKLFSNYNHLYNSVNISGHEWEEWSKENYLEYENFQEVIDSHNFG